MPQSWALKLDVRPQWEGGTNSVFKFSRSHGQEFTTFYRLFSFRQRASCQNFLTSLEDFSIKFYSIDLNCMNLYFHLLNLKTVQAFPFKGKRFVVIDTFFAIQSNHAYRNFFNTRYFSVSTKNVIMLGLYFDGLVTATVHLRFYLVIIFYKTDFQYPFSYY